MATFSLSLYFLLLQLLYLTTGGIFLRTDAAVALDSICAQTNQPRRCITLITSSSTRARTAAIPELAEIVITADTDAVGIFKIKIHGLRISARSPKIISIYQDCEDLHLDGLDQLLISPEYLQKRRFGKLIEAAAVVRKAVSGCAGAVAKDGGLKQPNEDAGILADAIVVIARRLAS